MGLKRSASEEEIKSAYVFLVKQYHPDLNKSESAARMMSLVNEAYETLND
jgi:DnaJ-class molecular chaperone